MATKNIISFSDEQVVILKANGYIDSHFMEHDLEAGIFDIKSVRAARGADRGCKFPRAYCLEIVAMLDHENVDGMIESAERLQIWLEGGEI